MAAEFSGEVKKEKKHKKRKVDEDAEVYVSDKKAKKEKKQKAEVQEAEIQTPESDSEIKLKKKKTKKEKRDIMQVEEPREEIADEREDVDEEAPRKKKKEKKQKKEDVVVEETPKKSKGGEDEWADAEKHESSVSVSTPQGYEEEWTGGARYWKRIDESKYKAKVEGTKFSKISHYDKGGDSWGNEAADVLSKVKGKGFVKAMQKLKRASWKGQGSIDTGVNSVQFSDWED